MLHRWTTLNNQFIKCYQSKWNKNKLEDTQLSDSFCSAREAQRYSHNIQYSAIFAHLVLEPRRIRRFIFNRMRTLRIPKEPFSDHKWPYKYQFCVSPSPRQWPSSSSDTIISENTTTTTKRTTTATNHSNIERRRRKYQKGVLLPLNKGESLFLWFRAHFSLSTPEMKYYKNRALIFTPASEMEQTNPLPSPHKTTTTKSVILVSQLKLTKNKHALILSFAWHSQLKFQRIYIFAKTKRTNKQTQLQHNHP